MIVANTSSMRDPHEVIGVAGWMARENREELARLIVEHDVKTVIEIGSFLGLSAIWFALRVEHVTCVDLWFEPAGFECDNNLVGTLRRWALPRDFFPMFRDNVMRSGVWHKILPVRGNSQLVSGEVGEADLVYIDGDHSYDGCRRDIELYAPKARKIVCGDDFDIEPLLEEDSLGVMSAVTETLPDHCHRKPFWWSIV